MPNFEALPSRSAEGLVRMVVEAPRGSMGKFAYDRHTRTFTLSKSLTLGLTYPFDWGFVPSTRAEDGDPIDVMALHDVPTFPGTVLLCKLIGVVLLTQKIKGKRRANNRLLAIPVNSKRSNDVLDARDLPKELLDELEEFFRETDAGQVSKEARVEGWAGPKAAERLLKAAERTFKHRGPHRK